MNFKETKELASKIEYPHLLAVQDVVWTRHEDYIYWYEKKGVYSALIVECPEEVEDMLICNADTECGYWMTYILPLEKELSYEEFEDKYQEFM